MLFLLVRSVFWSVDFYFFWGVYFGLCVNFGLVAENTVNDCLLSLCGDGPSLQESFGGLTRANEVLYQDLLNMNERLAQERTAWNPPLD